MTLQETKRRVAGAGVGIVLALGLVSMGFAAPAFADTSDTNVYFKADKSGDPDGPGTIDPGDNSGTDYDVNIPTDGIVGVIDPDTGAITYNQISLSKQYSVEIVNKSSLPIKIGALGVSDVGGFNYETTSSISTATVNDSIATTIAPATNTSAKIEIANAETAAVTPTGAGWSIASGATQGYVFADGMTKNLTKALPDTSATGLHAYTVEWTVEWA